MYSCVFGKFNDGLYFDLHFVVGGTAQFISLTKVSMWRHNHLTIESSVLMKRVGADLSSWRTPLWMKKICERFFYFFSTYFLMLTKALWYNLSLSLCILFGTLRFLRDWKGCMRRHRREVLIVNEIYSIMQSIW